jgi:heme-degrading monooxygenase HmoA
MASFECGTPFRYRGRVITSHRATLSVTSSTHPASAVSQILGMEPDRMREVGEPRGSSGAFPHSVWSVEGRDRSGGGFDSHARLDDLAARLHGKHSEIDRLREHYDVRVVYSGFSDSTQGGFVFPASTMAVLGALGCDISGTAYLAEDDPDGTLEHALLPVLPGREGDFEAAFDEARHIIAGAPGFRSLTLSRGVETRSHYLLLVDWDDLDAHENGFRGSPGYDRWRALLHHFYEPFPTVTHFERVTSAAPELA